MGGGELAGGQYEMPLRGTMNRPSLRCALSFQIKDECGKPSSCLNKINIDWFLVLVVRNF